MIRLFIISVLAYLTVLSASAEIKAGKVNEISEGEYKALVHDFTYNTDTWVYKGNGNIVIDFSATWCGPCKTLSPILDELAKEYSGKITFYKVDVDKCKNLAQSYGISSVPTMLFCPADGSKPTATTGAYPKEEIINVIEYVFE